MLITRRYNAMADSSARPEPASASKPKLRELLTDPEEIRDVLEAYGETVPDSVKAAKERLVELLADLSEEELLNTCFRLAANFARMAHEILELCGEFGIQGQIRLNTAKLD